MQGGMIAMGCYGGGVSAAETALSIPLFDFVLSFGAIVTI